MSSLCSCLFKELIAEAVQCHSLKGGYRFLDALASLELVMVERGLTFS